jgi:hypothetical protein
MKTFYSLGLGFVGRNDRWIAPWAGHHVGPQHQAGVVWDAVPHLLVIRPNLGVPLPPRGLHRRRGRRPPCAGIALVFEQVGGLHLVLPPRLLQRGQRSVGGLRGLKAFGLPVAQLCGDGLRCAMTRCRDRALRPLTGRR